MVSASGEGLWIQAHISGTLDEGLREARVGMGRRAGGSGLSDQLMAPGGPGPSVSDQPYYMSLPMIFLCCVLPHNMLIGLKTTADFG